MPSQDQVDCEFDVSDCSSGDCFGESESESSDTDSDYVPSPKRPHISTFPPLLLLCLINWATLLYHNLENFWI